MIQLKNSLQIEKMKQAGRITGEALLLAGEAVKEGVTTKHLDDIIRTYIEKCGAKPTFLGYGGFPGSACISINDQVIHGIPSKNVVLKLYGVRRTKTVVRIIQWLFRSHSESNRIIHIHVKGLS